MKTILILAPHTDDGELGCGGTISKKIELGYEIHYVAFSYCGSDTLKHEVGLACKILKTKSLTLFSYPVRTFSTKRQEILDDMIKLRENILPDIVFVPAPQDVHQDHQTITSEALRAFKFSSIIAYEMPWNNFSFHTNHFVILSEKDINNKCAALACYKSQHHRPYCNSEFIKSLAMVRGTQINTQYAESFEILRWID